MKIIILVLCQMFTFSTYANLAIKPGLWTIETKMKKDGKEFDPQSHMKAAMAKMSPEQKKQMEAMMAKMGNGASSVGLSEKGMQVCITGELLKNEKFLNQHRQKECETSFPVKTPTHVVTTFKCKSGADGTAEWKVQDSMHYNGTVKLTDKTGAKSEINYLGKFASADCGKVKPIEDQIVKKPVKK